VPIVAKEKPDVSTLVCCSCFTGPGSTGVNQRNRETGKIEQTTVTVSVFSVHLEPKPIAVCRHCGGRFSVDDLKRWNATMLEGHKKNGVKIRPVSTVRPLRTTNP
jgi:hypothetical protein